jgi:hypothetical protein
MTLSLAMHHLESISLTSIDSSAFSLLSHSSLWDRLTIYHAKILTDVAMKEMIVKVSSLSQIVRDVG